jgi:3-dehydroquinate synthase
MKWNTSALLASLALSARASAFTFGVNNKANSSTGIIVGGKSSISSSAPAFTTPSSNFLSMSSIVETETDYDVVTVDLAGGRDYPIYIGSKFDDEEAGKMLRSHIKGNRALLITNDRLAPMYLEKYETLLKEGGDIQIDTLVIPDGEANKTLDVMNLILDKCLELGLDRQVTMLALGGGVIGDMVGFAAAIYQRGVNFIQIPTTVMSMVDSSVGGKTGVNHPLGKNMVGAFHQPQCVFIDTETLSTLPDRELYSGVAEVIKYGLIRDAPFFEWLDENMEKINERDSSALRYAIKRSCENKAEVVKQDEREGGVRATLNLGHTFGHAIENGSGYGVWLHGEAVAIGTCMAATMSGKMGWIDEALVKRVYDIMIKAKCPVELPVDSPMNSELFLRAMSVDKKVANGQLRLILLKGELGNCMFTGDFDDGAMKETINEFVAECDGAQ